MPTHPSPGNVPEPKDSHGPETESKFRQEEVCLPPPQLLSSVVECINSYVDIVFQERSQSFSFVSNYFLYFIGSNVFGCMELGSTFLGTHNFRWSMV